MRSRNLPAAWVLLLGGCIETTVPAEDQLAAGEARWTAAALSSYAFDVQRSCFCPPMMTRPVTATVTGGAFTSLVYADSGTVADTTFFRDFLTVPRLFELVRRSLQQQPDSAAITYDSMIGYPRLVRLDFRRTIADEELAFEVLVFRRP